MSEETARTLVRELRELEKWVRAGTGYDTDDSIDEIARAIHNRVRYYELIATRKFNESLF